MKMNKSKVFSKFYHTIDENGDVRFFFSIDQKEIEMKEIQDIFIKRYLFDPIKKETYGEVEQIDVTENNDVNLGEDIINFSGIDKELKREGMYRYIIELYVREPSNVEETLSYHSLDKPAVRTATTIKTSKIEIECDIEYELGQDSLDLPFEEAGQIFKKVPLSAIQGLILEDSEILTFKKENYREYNNFVELKNTTKDRNVNLAQGTKTRDEKSPEEKFASIVFNEVSFADIEALMGFGNTIQIEKWQDKEVLQDAPVGTIFLAKNNNSKRYRNDYFFVEVTTSPQPESLMTISQRDPLFIDEPVEEVRKDG